MGALRRIGFTEVKKSRGRHQSFRKGSRVTVVVLGKREVPRGTLRGILELAGVSADEFLANLR